MNLGWTIHEINKTDFIQLKHCFKLIFLLKNTTNCRIQKYLRNIVHTATMHNAQTMLQLYLSSRWFILFTFSYLRKTVTEALT